MVLDDLGNMLADCNGSWADVVRKIGDNIEKPVDRLDLYLGILHELSDNPDAYDAVRKEMGNVNGEIRKEQEKLEDMAYVDVLTGLHNRRQFDESIGGVIKSVNNGGSLIDTSLIYFDIDHFKKFNDTFGHSAGDYVLNKLGGVIKDNTRLLDNPCRYGGEEFAVILPATDERGAYLAAENLRKAVEGETWEYNKEDLGKVTISLGVSGVRAGDSVEKFVNRADKALYEVKENGRNNVVLYRDKE